MSQISPPQVAEALLESFGADEEFTDAILGDLAQEYTQRVERYGATAARLWYYRQAVLASPPLLRNWLSSARWSDGRRLLNVAGLAYVTTLMINALLFFGGSAVGSTLLPKPVWSTVVSTSAVVLMFVTPFVGGYLAASFEEAKPMIAALALAFFWGVLQVLATGYAWLSTSGMSLGPADLARIVIVPILMTICVVGGMTRVRIVSARRAVAASSIPS